MILAEPMKRTLQLVEIFNGLDREQLYFLLKKEYHNRNVNMDIDRILRMKLAMMKDNEIIYIPDTEPNSDMREAVRILLAFWNKNVINYGSGNHNVLLKFSKLMKGEIYEFHICKDVKASDYRICKENVMVIIITDNKYLRYPFLKSYLLAVKEFGRYNFYKPTEEEQINEV